VTVREFNVTVGCIRKTSPLLQVDGMSHAILQESCALRKDGPGSNGSTVRPLSNQEVAQHGLSQHVAMFHKA
jgi:hypothetical protein